ncbi:BREX-3 system P-loop-containing protein BrxF [Fibrobacterota bacterium]
MIEEIIKQIESMDLMYHKLMLIVAKSGTGKTKLVQELSKKMEAPIINVNLEMSRRMLEFTERQRKLHANIVFEDLIKEHKSNTIFLDNIELLFDVELELDPLKLLKNIARNFKIICTWNGNVGENVLVYAKSGHPEYKKYDTKDILIFNLNDQQDFSIRNK